jgi:hypothetical protein
MLEGNTSVSSWKEKNVTLKEKHLHAKKNKLYFSYDFFKESLKNIPKGVRSTKMSSCNLT